MDALLEDIYQLLTRHNTTLSSVISHILTEPSSGIATSILLDDLLSSSHNTLSAFNQYLVGQDSIHHIAEETYVSEIKYLTDKESGWHFGSQNASAEQIQEFQLESYAMNMSIHAPRLWKALDGLMRGTGKSGGQPALILDDPEGEDEREYWRAVEGIDENLMMSTEGHRDRKADLAERSARMRKIENRRAAVLSIRKAVVLSIAMVTHNQKCNALPSILGIFCHSSNTAERVVEVLARMGITTSITSIHDAITSLSTKAQEIVRKLGETLTVAYAYDNFDVDLKSSVPTIEKSGDSLQHLTSGLLFSLPEGTTKEDLRCSDDLWKKSRLNDELPDDRDDIADKPDWTYLLRLHPKTKCVDSNKMTCRDRWNAWKFLHTLINEGPAEFRQFHHTLEDPEAIEQIPLSKTKTFPARAMDISNSTVAGNIETIINLMNQAGVGDPTEVDDEVINSLVEYVVFFHGDLGTGERITAAQLHRAIEESPYRRFQFVIFVFGLFHLKMACADALWRIFIRPPDSRLDPTSVVHNVQILRPTDFGKVTSNPGFRKMHQVIAHDGACRRLDCWRVEVSKRGMGESLKAFAESKPTFEELKTLANHLAMNYVANESILEDLRSHPPNVRDKQYENSLLVNQYYLLYEELSYAMNAGDIGRVETCLLPWAALCKATGKHKYAAAMVKHVTDLQSHFKDHPGLCRALRYSMLINPTGKAGRFRAVDWCLELNNLYTKTINVVSGPNKTVDNLIKESILVEIYRDCHLTIEKNMALSHLTTHHSEPNMTATFGALLGQFEKLRPHVPTPGRSSKYEILDMYDKGIQGLMASMEAEADAVAEEADDSEARPDRDDLSVDLI